MGQLDGKVAVITGGGSGIGLAVAQRYVDEGAEVLVVGRNKERLDEAVSQLGERASGFSVDVGNQEQVREFVEGVPRIDILAMFAGGAVFGKIDEVDPSEVLGLLAGRLMGQFYFCHYAVPKMPEGSVIICCSGIADRAHVAHYSGGSALCGAVNSMARNLCVELAPRGIRVNALSPGLIIPTSIQFNLGNEEAVEFLQRSMAAIPMGSYGDPSHMADAALFLATCGYVSGQVIEVDGGWTAA